MFNLYFKIYSTYLIKPRFYSNKSLTPILYANADTDKLVLLQDNKNKSSIYMWTNLKSRKHYIGSSLNLKRRFI